MIGTDRGLYFEAQLRTNPLRFFTFCELRVDTFNRTHLWSHHKVNAICWSLKFHCFDRSFHSRCDLWLALLMSGAVKSTPIITEKQLKLNCDRFSFLIRNAWHNNNCCVRLDFFALIFVRRVTYGVVQRISFHCWGCYSSRGNSKLLVAIKYQLNHETDRQREVEADTRLKLVICFVSRKKNIPNFQKGSPNCLSQQNSLNLLKLNDCYRLIS